jgi:hypothetical protein
MRYLSGVPDLGFKKLNDEDFKRILIKLASPRRERRPRKCQRLSGMDEVLAKISHPVSSLEVERCR